MPGDEGENGLSAGISGDGSDVAAVFERLKQEVRGRAPRSDAEGGSGPLAARAEAERLWAVNVDGPIPRRAGLPGRLSLPVKRGIRKLIGWYVRPFAAAQRDFNAQVLHLVDELAERDEAGRRRTEALSARVDERVAAELGELGARMAEAARRFDEVEDRVLRLERARRDRAPASDQAPQEDEGNPPPLDYFAFEARMRGTTAEIRERQRPYVDDLRGAGPVLDVGCGRGELLSLLREEGIEARGVDLDPDMVAFAAGEGLDVVEGDALAYLDGLEDGSLGGIFAAQVVEHLPPRALVRFLELAVRKLRAEGIFVAETINPLAPLSLRHYFSDLTHVQPLVPETLAILAREAGLRVDEIRYLHEPEQRLQPVEVGNDPADAALAHNVRLLNEHVFAPLDYALVARRP